MTMAKATKLAPNLAQKMIVKLNGVISMLGEIPANQFHRKAWAAIGNELDRLTATASTVNDSVESDDNEDFITTIEECFENLDEEPAEVYMGSDEPEDEEDVLDSGDITDDGYDVDDDEPVIGDSGYPMGK